MGHRRGGSQPGPPQEPLPDSRPLPTRSRGPPEGEQEQRAQPWGARPAGHAVRSSALCSPPLTQDLYRVLGLDFEVVALQWELGFLSRCLSEDRRL